MSRLFKSLVLVLKRRPLGEADEILSLLSPELGRFDAATRGSRKSTSSLVGRVEPFTELSALFAQGRSLDHLTQATVHRSRPGLQRDLERLVQGSYLLDLVGGILPFREPCPDLYALLVQALDGLEAGGSPTLCRWVELHLADLLGYAPQLDSCALCGSAAPDRFAADCGGAVCRSCLRGEEVAAMALSPAARSALRHLRGCRMESAQRLRLEPGPAREVEGVLVGHLQHHWPRALRSREVLRNLLGVS